LPARTGSGVAVFVTARSAWLAKATVTLAVALLFEEFGSEMVEDPESVSLITVPAAVPAFTLTTKAKLAVIPDAKVAIEQLMLPVPPMPGELHVQPPGAAKDTKVVFVGTVSAKATLVAVAGPPLVRVWV
jgi:hypothetical protein